MHRASIESLLLSLSIEAVISIKEARAQLLEAAMKARDDKISGLQKTIMDLAQLE